MQTALFISREIADSSPVYLFAEAKNWAVHATSLLEFNPVPFTQLPACDWVFFYSKKGVQFFFEGLQKAELSLPKKVKIATLGDGTAKAMKGTGRTPDFSGNGKPETVAAAFRNLAEGQRVLFPHARASRKSIQTLLKDVLEVLDLVVYSNEVRTDLVLPQHAKALLFTSPMNATAWYQHANVSLEQYVIAIGETTAKKLRELGVSTVFVAKEPSEKAMIACLENALS